MEIGIDSFAAASIENENNTAENNSQSLKELLARIAFADEMGLDVFGIGEHHRKESIILLKKIV